MVRVEVMMMDCFCGMVDRRKALSRDYCQRFSLSPNAWQAMRGIWTCAKTEFKLCWMKLCSSNKHYNTAQRCQVDLQSTSQHAETDFEEVTWSFRVGAFKNKNIDYWGKEVCAMFGLPIQNKSIAINVSLPFFVIRAVYLTKLSFLNIETFKY